jgi:hypothetical protein
MEREIDLAPRHLVDWLKAEIDRGQSRRLEVRASREFLAGDGAFAGEDLDAEDGVAVATTVGLLEVAPPAGGHRWVLRLRIEDAIGNHLPDEGSVPDEPEPLGLEEFVACFLAGQEPDATVTLEAGTPADHRDFDRLLARILTDRHAGRR